MILWKALSLLRSSTEEQGELLSLTGTLWTSFSRQYTTAITIQIINTMTVLKNLLIINYLTGLLSANLLHPKCWKFWKKNIKKLTDDAKTMKLKSLLEIPRMRISSSSISPSHSEMYNFLKDLNYKVSFSKRCQLFGLNLKLD